MLKEPGIAVNCISVAFNNIGHRIELEDPLVLVRYNVQVPENRCSPLEKLKSYVDYLQKISKEHHNCAGCIAYGQNQNKFAAHIVDELEPVNTWIIAVYAGNE